MTTLSQTALDKELGIKNLPQKDKNRIYNKITENIQYQLIIDILDNLSGTKQKELRNLVDKSKHRAIATFLENNIPDLDTKIETATRDVINKLKTTP